MRVSKPDITTTFPHNDFRVSSFRTIAAILPRCSFETRDSQPPQLVFYLSAYKGRRVAECPSLKNWPVCSVEVPKSQSVVRRMRGWRGMGGGCPVRKLPPLRRGSSLTSQKARRESKNHVCIASARESSLLLFLQLHQELFQGMSAGELRGEGVVPFLEHSSTMPSLPRIFTSRPSSPALISHLIYSFI
jgi:hypothetical protein